MVEDDEENFSLEYLVYSEEEREKWEVVMVLPGVEVIPELTFYICRNVKEVIMSDSVKRIENEVFQECHSLVFVKLSRTLEYIGWWAFCICTSLTSIFIPPSCGEIDGGAFSGCKKLIILGLPLHTQLGRYIFESTALMDSSPIETDFDVYDYDNEEAVQWVKSINNGEANSLHRACSSFNPIVDIIHDLVKRQGIGSMRKKNVIGITPSQYLEANTFADISEKEIINRYISEMLGVVF